MVSCETGWPIYPGSGLAWPDYISRLRACQMGGGRAENGARTAVFLHLASSEVPGQGGVPDGRPLKRPDYACRIQVGEDRNWHVACAYGVWFRQYPWRRSS